MLKNTKGNKYKNKKIEFEGIKFDSKAEMDYYIDIRTSAVEYIKIQPVYLLQEKFSSKEGNIAAITYKADFEIKYSFSNIMVIDIKGLPTEVAKIKRKMFLKNYPDHCLKWLVKYDGHFVDYFENEKRKKNNKLLKTR